MVTSFGTAAKQVIPLIGTIFSGLLTSLPTLVSQLGPVLSDAFAQLDIIGGINTLLDNAIAFFSNFDLSGAASDFIANLSSSIQNGDLSDLLTKLGELAGKMIKAVADFITNPSN